MTAYEDLQRRFGRIGRLGEAIEMLHWDMSTVMPAGGAQARGEQLAILNGLVHELLADPAVADGLEAAAGERLDEWQAANLREMRSRWIHQTAVPGDLVEALTRAGAKCEMVWREARKANDFERVAPLLAEVLSLVREKAAAKAEALGVSRYDALLDEFEPGGTSARVDALFDELVGFLPDLVGRVLEHQARRGPALMPEGPFPVEQQRALGLRMMRALGFDFEHGRLDTSHHPFCGGGPDDVRITTRYSDDDFTKSLMGVLHETGHALYELGLPAEWRSQPVGAARGMGFHESQSLLMEMQACRSRAFLEHLTPIARETFGGEGPAWTPENLYRLYTRVQRGFIRVDADECTYPAHVVLRYRLERRLLEGTLEIADLPAAWSEGMAELVGVTPPDHDRGCLQDIHWMQGAFGYFPTYTIGAMTAAQLFDAATRADGDILPSIGRGEFGPMLAWLRENVHRYGSFLSSDELLTQATGKPLDVQVFRAHLERRYLGEA